MLAAVASSPAQKLSPLASRPDWRRLDAFQESITREQFLRLLDRVYAPDGAWKDVMEVGQDEVRIRTSPGKPDYVLKFAPSREDSKAITRYWRGKRQLGPRIEGKPLQGLRIAIDPGHLGGNYAQMEERWFQIGNSKPVTEGDMTLLVAKKLVPRLKALGAEVYLTRSRPGPTTNLRPNKLHKAAVESLRDKGSAATERAVQRESELLFYRVGEIRHRAQLVNEKIRPDLVLCLHFNAEPWGNAAHPTLTDVNHLHFLVNGAYGRNELEYEDQRYNMLVKLLNRAFEEEVAVTKEVADAMAKETGLPPYTYQSTNAIPVGAGPYVWGRNLLANRLFECPVVFLEPYVMNSREVFARVQAGDYSGRRNVAGKMVPSIYEEYVNGLLRGLVNYYSKP